mmetsp:Transcript_25071/g.64600  ORF Transcript_25071/g.64600 Transcript_25071/m.64600 type:complete len:157 (+) Transcript_25071:362-832(+)
MSPRRITTDSIRVDSLWYISLSMVGGCMPADPGVARHRTDPASGQSRVVGLACLSFTPSTRDQFNTLQPGDECCYLSNMAVDQKMRRQGVAIALLSACDKYVRENTEMRRIQLHVRLDATAAKALYAKWGYKTQAEDGFMVRLRGDSQRALMCKDL